MYVSSGALSGVGSKGRLGQIMSPYTYTGPTGTVGIQVSGPIPTITYTPSPTTTTTTQAPASQADCPQGQIYDPLAKKCFVPPACSPAEEYRLVNPGSPAQSGGCYLKEAVAPPGPQLIRGDVAGNIERIRDWWPVRKWYEAAASGQDTPQRFEYVVGAEKILKEYKSGVRTQSWPVPSVGGIKYFRIGQELPPFPDDPLPIEWRGFLGAYVNWAVDRSIPAERIAAAIRNVRMLQEVHLSIPWPHEFFQGLTTERKTHGKEAPFPPAFYQEYRYFDPELTMSDYFPRSREEIERDVAQFLQNNPDALARHFEAEFQRYLKKQEEHLKSEAREGKIVGYAFKALGLLIGLSAAPAMIGAVNSIVGKLVGLSLTMRLMKESQEVEKEIYKVLSVPDEALATFQRWILARVPSVKEWTPEPRAPFPWTPVLLVGGGVVVGGIVLAIALSKKKKGKAHVS